MVEKLTLLKNITLITPYEQIEDGFLIINNDRILTLGNENELGSFSFNFKDIIDLKGYIAVPGFIDIHTHGGAKIDITTQPEKLDELSKFKSTTGVAYYLPTTWSEIAFKDLMNSLEIIAEGILKTSEPVGSIPIGVNMEAPFLYPGLGAHKGDFDVNPDKEKVKEILNRGKGCVKIINIAPELEGALDAITLFNNSGVISSIGHSIAEPDTLALAIERGANLATHLLNGTYPPSATEKGVVPVGLNEYLMIRDDVYAEAIVDHHGAHIHPIMLEILCRCKGINNIILITDSMFTAGLDPGNYQLSDGRTIHCDGYVNRLPDQHLTGSSMNLNKCLSSFIRQMDLPLTNAVKTVTVNPARLLGIEKEVGMLQAGKKANITIVNEHLDVYMTIVHGKIVYRESNITTGRNNYVRH